MAYTTAPVSDLDGIQSVIDIAQQATEARELTVGKVYGWLTPRGVEKIDLTGDEYRDAPRAKTGTTIVRDTASLLAYLAKHADENSELYADERTLTVLAVLDAHTLEAPRWARHRVLLELRQTEAWIAWNRLSGKLLAQDDFAEFLEDHLSELISPDAATMLEIAQSLQATSKVSFTSSSRLATGQRTLSYVEDVQTKAGQKGTLTIPEVFTIGVQPFDGAEPYQLDARLRYRINGSELTIGFKLVEPEKTVRAAFGDVINVIDGEVATPIMHGTPAR